MASTRQEGRGRPSRSRQNASNKENICPSQGTGLIAAEMPHRRSPLPEGFPRSPLQDITHIICPNNRWPTNEDLLTNQVRKKFRKDNSAGNCVDLGSNETTQQKAAQQQCNLSWEGLAPCMHVNTGSKLVQTEVITMDSEVSKQSPDVEVETISNKAGLQKHAADLCIYRDTVSTDVISLQNCDNKHGQDVKSGDQVKQTGELDAQALLIQHRNVSTKKSKILKQRIGSSAVQVAVGKDNQPKRLQQSAQSKKKSSLSLLR